MIFLDATADSSTPVNVPAGWNLDNIKMLYPADFYPGGADRTEAPDPARIKELAEQWAAEPLVCINIGEGKDWGSLLQPGTWSWNNTPQPHQVNKSIVAKQFQTLSVWKNWNTTSKVSWWNLPNQLPGYDIGNKYDEYGWLGPQPDSGDSWPYVGHVGVMMWQAGKLRGLIDFTMSSGYFAAKRMPTFDVWRQSIVHIKAVSACGYGVPAGITVLPRVENEPHLEYFPRGQLRRMDQHINAVFEDSDFVAWWESGFAPELNAQLAAYDPDDAWIETWNQWFTE